MQILYHPHFERDFQKLPSEAQKAAARVEAIFRENPRYPSLKLHKLRGKLRGLYAISVTQKYRIVLEFDGDDAVFLMIGDHDMYR